MATILSGKAVAESITEKTKAKAEELTDLGRQPVLLIVRVGEKGSDLSYERGVTKRAENSGIAVRVEALPENISEEALVEVLKRASEDSSVSGVLPFLPLPRHLNEKKVLSALAPEKDIDGATSSSMLGVYAGTGEGYSPCTPEAVIRILDHYGVELTGKKVAVVGRSLVVGKPLAMLLLSRNATVTLCHTKTEELPKETRRADILVVATGHAKTICQEHVRAGQIVLDVGINFDENGKMCGDAAFGEIEPVVGAITPVPGGVGTVTNAVLLAHVVEAAAKAYAQDPYTKSWSANSKKTIE